MQEGDLQMSAQGSLKHARERAIAPLRFYSGGMDAGPRRKSPPRQQLAKASDPKVESGFGKNPMLYSAASLKMGATEPFHGP